MQEYENLVRVEGRYEGNLKSPGDLEIGPKGHVRGTESGDSLSRMSQQALNRMSPVSAGNLMGMNEIICEGKIVGNIQCERLILTNGAQAFGNVSVRKLLLEEGAVHVGMMNCHKDAPKILQEDGTLADPPPEPGELRKFPSRD